MNWAQFKDPHCYLCLRGAVQACWLITQEVGGLNTSFCKNNFYRFGRFFRINLGKTQLHLSVSILSAEETFVIAKYETTNNNMKFDFD